MKHENKNNIVRVRNSSWKKLIRQMMRETGCTYQLAFEVICDYVESGYTLGDRSQDKIFADIMEYYYQF